MPRHSSKRSGTRGSFKPGHPFFPSTSGAGDNISRQQHDRRRETTSTSHLQDQDEYIIVNKEKVEHAWNTNIKSHFSFSPNCVGLLTMKKEYQWSISTSWSFSCDHCDYHSNNHKMYKTIDTGSKGRKASSLNKALGVALVKSSIGATGISEIFLTLGINPGSYRGLTRLVNSGSETCKILCQENTATERSKLGNAPHVAIEGDSRYNNPIRGNTPFQAGTQVAWTVCEGVSKSKKIVHLVTENKLCTRAASLRRQGENVSCPDHSGRCTATMRQHESIGREGVYAKKSAEVLKEEGINVKYITSDGDCEIGNAFKETYPAVEWMKDARHFSLSQMKAIKAAKFSDQMFPTATKVQRQRDQQWFAEDIRQRCSAELTAAVNKCQDIQDKAIRKAKISALLFKTPDAIIDCYQGNCHLCGESSLVCSGENQYAWPKHFQSSMSRNKMRMTDADKDLLKDLILKRLGGIAIGQTYLNSNTQKVEAVHRAYSKTNPKIITSPRNFDGRIGAAVLNVNMGFEGSTRLVQAAAGHDVCEEVKKVIKKRSDEIKVRREMSKSPEYKRRRVFQRASKYRLYEERQNTGASSSDTYEKEVAINSQ